MKLIGWASPQQIERGVELLREACDVLDNQGWIQGLTINGAGRCCAQGAIMIAEYGDGSLPQFLGMDDPALIAMCMFQRVKGVYLPTFNDAEGRTVGEVKQALREVADEAEREVNRWRSSLTGEA